MAASSPDTPTPARPNAPRWFGRFQLTRLLGKSERTMAWLVHDPRKGRPLMIVLPRVQPVDAQALENWQLATRQAARLDHPNLAAIVESGVQDGWPWVAHDPGAAQTLADRIPGTGMAGSEVAALGVQLLQGLAFAHEAGLVHHDVQPYLLLLPDGGQSQLAGLAVAAAAPSGAPYVSPSEATMRRTQRAAAEHDVLALSLIHI